MKRAISLAGCALVVSLAAAAASAGEAPTLRGAYGFAGTAACHADGASLSPTFALDGVAFFDHDGTGTVKGTAIVIEAPPRPGPARSASPAVSPDAASDTFSFSFTYRVSPEGGFAAEMVPGTFSGTFTPGQGTSPVAQSHALDRLPTLSGSLSWDGKTLMAGRPSPEAATLAHASGCQLYDLHLAKRRMFGPWGRIGAIALSSTSVG
jgi:hypothetical protein